MLYYPPTFPCIVFLFPSPIIIIIIIIIIILILIIVSLLVLIFWPSSTCNVHVFFSYRARSGSTSKMIDTSVTQLSGYIQLATDSIFESFEKCPLVLRQSMRLLWDRVIAKFPDNVSTCVIYIIFKCKPAWYLHVFTRFSVIEWVWEGLWVFWWFF